MENGKISDEKIKEICDWISNGNSNIDAAILSDISEFTFYEWKKRGKKDIKNKVDTEYSKFSKSLKKAEIEFKNYHVFNIQKQSDKNWPASALLLERKYFNEYGKKEKIELTNKLDDFCKSFDALREKEDATT